MAYGLWTMLYALWPFGLWFGLTPIAYAPWHMAYGLWPVAFGLWTLVHDVSLTLSPMLVGLRLSIEVGP